jgi:predicted DNA-binding protein (MmcQ/YjbR family)
MNEAALRKLTKTWPAIGAEVKWVDDLVFMVDGRMFCSLCLRGPAKGKLSFKVEAGRFLELTDRPGFRPSPYLARAHWVTLDDPGVVAKGELEGLVRTAYEQVFAKLAKRRQKELAAT